MVARRILVALLGLAALAGGGALARAVLAEPGVDPRVACSRAALDESDACLLRCRRRPQTASICERGCLDRHERELVERCGFRDE